MRVWSRRACAEACPQAGAHSPPEKSLLRNSLTEELSVGSNAGGRVIAQELRNKSQSCWFGNLQGQPKSHQPFTSFEPETLPSSCVACTQCLSGRHTREQATQTQSVSHARPRNKVNDLNSRSGVLTALWLDSEGADWCVGKLDTLPFQRCACQRKQRKSRLRVFER